MRFLALVLTIVALVGTTVAAAQEAGTLPLGSPAWVTTGTEGLHLRVHAEPMLASEQVGSLANGTEVQVLEGPVTADEHTWYRIEAAGLAGPGWVDGASLSATPSSEASGAAASGLGSPSGPGQAVSHPPAQCGAVLACRYSERNSLPNGYRFQALEVCGANCTTQYWVTSIPDGRLLLTIEPVRGGGIVAIGRGTGPDDPHPSVRTVVPAPQPADPACCPSQYLDTTYTWSPSEELVAGTPTVIPAEQFGGWDSVRQSLEAEQFSEVFGGL
jgi:hypothetical protein